MNQNYKAMDILSLFSYTSCSCSFAIVLSQYQLSAPVLTTTKETLLTPNETARLPTISYFLYFYMMSKQSRKTETKRPLDVYFDKYQESHNNPANEIIHWICVPLIVFSLLGLVWSIPFPHLAFLGKYNMYLNWASFLIAFSIYYYYRLSPVLSYFMLLLIAIMSYGIVGLEQWQKNGGPALWLVCLIIFLFSWVGQFIGHKIEGRKPSFLDDIKFLLIGPIWLLHFICRKIGIRY